ncbi:MAG: cupin domain-containing protein [Denitrobacterium sp.]|jgi:quercetin dioxygenase-like cupin family protein|nr:cupin domain-containing protein [Denitrobacterium sp.]MCI1480803.1 cupin domain-containing protein [Eggerthellaceae bacterium]
MADLIKNVEKSVTFELAGIADCEPGAVNSVTLAQQPGCKMTVLAFGDGESIAAHSAPGDALVTCIAGKGEVTLEGVPHVLTRGQAIVMPAGAEHAVRGIEGYKMLLTVVKE